MTRGPLRLRDDPELPDELRELMSQPHEGPPALDKAVKAGSIASILAGAGTASASVAATGVTATGVKLWLLIGGLCAGGIAAGVAWLPSGSDPAEPVTEASPVAPATMDPESSAVVSPVEARVPPPLEEPAEAEVGAESAPETFPAASRARPNPTPEVPSVDALRAEAGLLEAARAQLETDPRGALRATRRHAIAHPRGQLQSERELIAIEALQRLGRSGAAERRARGLLRAHPTGIYADRVRRLLSSMASEPATGPNP